MRNKTYLLPESDQSTLNIKVKHYKYKGMDSPIGSVHYLNEEILILREINSENLEYWRYLPVLANSIGQIELGEPREKRSVLQSLIWNVKVCGSNMGPKIFLEKVVELLAVCLCSQGLCKLLEGRVN